MSRDPIIEEVRTARERIAAECDYDMHKIYQRGCGILRRWKGKVVTHEQWLRSRGRRKPPT
jgi:hypothetical protein